MNDTSNNKEAIHQQFVDELSEELEGYSVEEVWDWCMNVRALVTQYEFAAQLAGDIYLVHDNTIIQDFKHREQPNRNLRRLACVAFNRFAAGWSVRPTRIAVSPAIIYEHVGRCVVTSVGARTALDSVFELLRDQALSIHGLGFNTPDQLRDQIASLHDDAIYLTNLFSSLDRRSWAIDVRAYPYNPLAMSLADQLIPRTLPLRYFDQWHVRLVLLLRAERKIIDQTKAKYGIELAGSDRESEATKLNTVCKRRNILTGLGDLDLLSHCSVNSQCRRELGIVLVGQTFDKNLRDALSARQNLVKSSHVEFGQSDTEAQLAQLTRTMRNGFNDEDKRAARLRPSVQAFLSAVLGTFDRLFPGD